MPNDWKTLPSLTALRAFDATAKHGGFAGAARALNVTDAAVAQQVRALEVDLAVRLAIRQGRNIKLTEQGKSLARSLSDSFRNISDEITSLRENTLQRGLSRRSERMPMTYPTSSIRIINSGSTEGRPMQL